MAHQLPSGISKFNWFNLIESKEILMKFMFRHLITALVLFPATVLADATPLKCKMVLSQGTGFDSRLLRPRGEVGNRFASFSLNLEQKPQELVEHQNVCVNKRDFRHASFNGFLCVRLITTQDSPDAATPGSLQVNVSRDVIDARSIEPSDPAPELPKQSLGSVRADIPLSQGGRYFAYTQYFANKGGKAELESLFIECGTRYIPKFDSN
jgi:hypothetical protein